MLGMVISEWVTILVIQNNLADKLDLAKIIKLSKNFIRF